MGPVVKRLGELTGVASKMHEVSFLEEQGQYSLTALSESLVNIGKKYNIHSEFTNGAAPLGEQLQSLIDALVIRGVVKYEDF